MSIETKAKLYPFLAGSLLLVVADLLGFTGPVG